MNKPIPKVHRITNWFSYNKALINRGNISILFDPTTQWYVQPHIGIDAKTLQIRAVQLTTNNVSDLQVLGIYLIKFRWMSRLDEQIDPVYTDGSYDTKYCKKSFLINRHMR